MRKLKNYVWLLLALGCFVGGVFATESSVVSVGGGPGAAGDVITVTHTGSTPSAATVKVALTVQGNTSLTSGNLIFSTVGKGVQITEGTNGRTGRVTLASGMKVVSNSAVTSNTRYLLGRSSLFGTAGHLYISSPNSVNFTIKSTSTTDESVVDYLLIEAQ